MSSLEELNFQYQSTVAWTNGFAVLSFGSSVAFLMNALILNNSGIYLTGWGEVAFTYTLLYLGIFLSWVSSHINNTWCERFADQFVFLFKTAAYTGPFVYLFFVTYLYELLQPFKNRTLTAAYTWDVIQVQYNLVSGAFGGFCIVGFVDALIPILLWDPIVKWGDYIFMRSILTDDSNI